MGDALHDDDGSVKFEFVNMDSLEGYLYYIDKVIDTQAGRSLRTSLVRLDPVIRRHAAGLSDADDDQAISSIVWAVIQENNRIRGNLDAPRPPLWARVPSDVSITYDMLRRAIKLKVKDIVKGESGLAFTDAYYAQKEAKVGHDHVAEPP
jgi:hypothetical protein